MSLISITDRLEEEMEMLKFWQMCINNINNNIFGKA